MSQEFAPELHDEELTCRATWPATARRNALQPPPAVSRKAAGVRGPESRRLRVVTVAATDVSAVVDPLFVEYGEWVAVHLARDAGITFTAADLARHHDAFRGELAGLLGRRGRLLAALLDGEPVGVGALKPVDDTIAEIKRMYVRPGAQGLGAGRAILTHLIQAACHEHYTTVRLETLRFMTTAQTMYRGFGFVETSRFDGAETANTPLDPLTTFMELDLAADRPLPSRHALSVDNRDARTAAGAFRTGPL